MKTQAPQLPPSVAWKLGLPLVVLLGLIWFGGWPFLMTLLLVIVVIGIVYQAIAG